MALSLAQAPVRPGTGINWLSNCIEELHLWPLILAVFFRRYKRDGWIGDAGLSHVFVVFFSFFLGWGGKNDLGGENFRERVVRF